MQTRTITIDPITRLEGHGKIDIFLDDKGEVERAYFQVPELRGFETFSIGRPAEDMPQITSRICGVCPTAHHMAGTKALDDLYKIEAPPTGRKIRELVYNTFMLEDHALHVYFLGGPDFIVGPTAPKARRNVVGVIAEGRRRRWEEGHRDAPAPARSDLVLRREGDPPRAGSAWRRGQGPEPGRSPRLQTACRGRRGVREVHLAGFKDIVLKNPEYVKLITSDTLPIGPTTWVWWTRTTG